MQRMGNNVTLSHYVGEKSTPIEQQFNFRNLLNVTPDAEVLFAMNVIRRYQGSDRWFCDFIDNRYLRDGN